MGRLAVNRELDLVVVSFKQDEGGNDLMALEAADGVALGAGVELPALD